MNITLWSCRTHFEIKPPDHKTPEPEEVTKKSEQIKMSLSSFCFPMEGFKISEEHKPHTQWIKLHSSCSVAAFQGPHYPWEGQKPYFQRQIWWGAFSSGLHNHFSIERKYSTFLLSFFFFRKYSLDWRVFSCRPNYVPEHLLYMATKGL